jgi:hypothetical protein
MHPDCDCRTVIVREHQRIVAAELLLGEGTEQHTQLRFD